MSSSICRVGKAWHDLTRIRSHVLNSLLCLTMQASNQTLRTVFSSQELTYQECCGHAHLWLLLYPEKPKGISLLVHRQVSSPPVPNTSAGDQACNEFIAIAKTVSQYSKQWIMLDQPALNIHSMTVLHKRICVYDRLTCPCCGLKYQSTLWQLNNVRPTCMGVF